METTPISSKGLTIYYVIRDGGGGGEGSPQFITIISRGVFKVNCNITVFEGKWKVMILFQFKMKKGTIPYFSCILM